MERPLGAVQHPGITDYDPANPGTFTRGTAALWAWNAMSALIANSDRSNIAGQMRLADRLMSYSKITAAQGLNSGLFTGKGGITLVRQPYGTCSE